MTFSTEVADLAGNLSSGLLIVADVTHVRHVLDFQPAVAPPKKNSRESNVAEESKDDWNQPNDDVNDGKWGGVFTSRQIRRTGGRRYSRKTVWRISFRTPMGEV